MRISFAFTYAFRCLGFGQQNSESNARKTLIGAIFGIALSVIPLIVVLVVADGMIAGITSRLIELDSGHIKIIKMRVVANENDGRHEKTLKKQLIKKHTKNSFFENAWVERSSVGLLIGNDGRSGATIRAIENNFFAENQKAKKLLKVVAGSTVLENDNEVLLGTKIAENLKLKVGDTCRLLTLKESSTGNLLPKFTNLKVKGIVSCGYQELDALWVFISLEKGLNILNSKSSLTSVLISTKNAFDNKNFDRFFEELNTELTDNFVAYSWKSLNRSQYSSFKTTKNLLMFIMLLILLVASVNISSALIMLVLERNREIAILKSTGASSNLITLSFFISGMLTSLFGLIFGLPIGILIAININSILSIIENFINGILIFSYKILNISDKILEFHILDPAYYLENIPINLKLYDLLLIAIMATTLSAIVSIIPSKKAGSERPIEIMRKV